MLSTKKLTAVVALKGKNYFFFAKHTSRHESPFSSMSSIYGSLVLKLQIIREPMFSSSIIAMLDSHAFFFEIYPLGLLGVDCF